jgi:hypothetical protein
MCTGRPDKGSKVRRFEGSKVRGFEGSTVRGFEGSRVRRFEGSTVRRFGSSAVRQFGGPRDNDAMHASGSALSPAALRAFRALFAPAAGK